MKAKHLEIQTKAGPVAPAVRIPAWSSDKTKHFTK
jgi:hypothetical protein